MLNAFTKKGIIILVKAPTPENAEQTTDELARELSKNHDLFPAVELLDRGAFFERNGLLFGSVEDVKNNAEGLTKVQLFIGALAGEYWHATSD